MRQSTRPPIARRLVSASKVEAALPTAASCCTVSMAGRRGCAGAKDIIALHLSDLGGMDNTSAAERSIIRRASVMTVELERMERAFALAGEASAEDLDIYARVAGNLRRLLESVGLQRRARDISPPSVAAYLEHKARLKAATP